MKKIDKFYCIQREVFADGSEKVISEGQCEIEQELMRPEIFFEGESLIKCTARGVSMDLTFNPNSHPNLGFTDHELIFLSDTFDFNISERKTGYKLAKISNDDRFSVVNLVWIATILKKEYIIIESKRWQFNFQPRGAGEDAMGEDVTYIHGIWEKPELPESIMKKIKGEY